MRGDFEDYVRRERGGLLRYAVLLCGSQTQAEDIVQEVLARVYLRWDTLDPDFGRKSYLRRSVTNEYLSWRRRWSTRMITLVDSTDLPETAQRDSPGQRDEQLWQCLQQLPPRQRAAVVLRYYDERTDEEIADILGCRASTVRGFISRALATLRHRPDIRAARENLT